MIPHEKINYVELPAKDIESTKVFFNEVFNWSFVDYGSDYTSFSNEGLDGGFFKSKRVMSQKNGSALIVFYSKSLEKTQAKIEAAGGNIIQAIYSFPGGRRFHFSDPNGNEFAVWSGLLSLHNARIKG
ncbi:VOC family protein [Shewanella surugensis]|uniref:VOC family protein n=1 Tax=Shewanella surugensis TaxID=212020 RepID=A0ABT0LF07_9GAMM|nr:VOC family protein [Shewanella surugensis]MCL1126075.1 VOC family protein [Shewanella surugensis]